MKKILITGATDGIGYETAKELAKQGHHVIVHGRSREKLEKLVKELKLMSSEINVDSYKADFSVMKQVKNMADQIKENYSDIDVLINNAGIFMAKNNVTVDGLELRFAVNTIAPFLLTKLLQDNLASDARIINLSSAAQATVDFEAVKSYKPMTDNEAYAQSKLAITMWSIELANQLKKANSHQQVIAVNPKSFLGSKMVKEAYGTSGHDIKLGADILIRAALSEEFSNANGKYYDNDIEAFGMPHSDAADNSKRIRLISIINDILKLTD